MQQPERFSERTMSRRQGISILTSFLLAIVPWRTLALAAEGPQKVVFGHEAGRIQIAVNGKRFATYVFQDAKTLHPYFANVRAPDGIQLTRHHPPREGQDSIDAATSHTGVWQAFGDLSGGDSWHNRDRVEHVEFIYTPRVNDQSGTFAVENRHYRGATVVCTEVCRYEISLRPNGYLLICESTFENDGQSFYFGDEEDMGLAIRVSDPLRVEGGGGQILNSDGRMNESEVRGSRADWCVYGGSIGGKRAGILAMPSPRNFRRCWYHARDYGLLVANPFGREALSGGKESKVVVKPRESFRLGWGLLFYSSPREQPVDLKDEYRYYSRRCKQ